MHTGIREVVLILVKVPSPGAAGTGVPTPKPRPERAAASGVGCRVLAFQSRAEGGSGDEGSNKQVASADGRRGRATVLYRDADTVVTTAFFESGGRRYPVSELTTVRRVEQASWAKPRQYELWAQGVTGCGCSSAGTSGSSAKSAGR